MPLAALVAVKPGQRSRLIYRVHASHRSRNGRRKGFAETDYARLPAPPSSSAGHW